MAHLDDVLYTLYRNRVIQVYLWWKLSGPTMRVSSDDDWELHSLGAKDMTQEHGPSWPSRQWPRPRHPCHQHHGLGLSAGSKHGCFYTGRAGLVGLAACCDGGLGLFFPFYPILLFLYYFVCVSDRDGFTQRIRLLPFFSSMDLLGPLMLWSPRRLGHLCLISFLRHFFFFLPRQRARAVMNELWQGQPTSPGDFGTGYWLAIGEGEGGA